MGHKTGGHGSGSAFSQSIDSWLAGRLTASCGATQYVVGMPFFGLRFVRYIRTWYDACYTESRRQFLFRLILALIEGTSLTQPRRNFVFVFLFLVEYY